MRTRSVSPKSSMFASGSPCTATTSASMPARSMPMSSCRPMSFAGVLVAATMACIGVMPPSTMRTSSRPLPPWSPTPESVPSATVTPAAGAQLDVVGARAQHFADPPAHGVDAVDARVRSVQGAVDEQLAAAGHGGIGVAAGLAEDGDAEAHPRAGEEAVLHRVAPGSVDDAVGNQRNGRHARQRIALLLRSGEMSDAPAPP